MIAKWGLQKKARTSDHMFILKTIIDKYCNNKDVDFQKAFDTVIHIGKPLKGIISYAETLFHLDQTLKTVFMFLTIPLNLFYCMVQKYGVTLTHLRKNFNQMI